MVESSKAEHQLDRCHLQTGKTGGGPDREEFALSKSATLSESSPSGVIDVPPDAAAIPSVAFTPSSQPGPPPACRSTPRTLAQTRFGCREPPVMDDSGTYLQPQ